MWGGVTVDRNCDTHQGGVKGIRKVCQLMERCDSHGQGVRVCGKCESCQAFVEHRG